MDSGSEHLVIPAVKRTRPSTRTVGPAQNGNELRSGRSQYPAHSTETPAERVVLRSRKTDSRNGITSRVLSGVQHAGAGANRMARLAGFPKKQRPGVTPRIGRRGDGDLKVVVVSTGKDALSAGAVSAERRDETRSGRNREQEDHESRVVPGASVTRIGSLRSRVR